MKIYYEEEFLTIKFTSSISTFYVAQNSHGFKKHDQVYDCLNVIAVFVERKICGILYLTFFLSSFYYCFPFHKPVNTEV